LGLRREQLVKGLESVLQKECPIVRNNRTRLYRWQREHTYNYLGGRERVVSASGLTGSGTGVSKFGGPSKSVRRSRHASLSVRTAEEKQAAGDGGAS